MPVACADRRSPPCQSGGGGDSLSGCGMLDHRGQMTRSHVASSFPREGPKGAGGAMLCTGRRRRAVGGIEGIVGFSG